ncbi:unnamed protein product [Mytilus edulis]|uniref:Uncharacterized protein n=1 Tax=Mytilus edulis TaxID=6550 RepID=A0A8S3UM80_MYTED|nr:unnamed protein product [Mytilus edulis]
MVEAIQRTAVPDELIQFFNETESVSLNGDPYTGEGLDFKAETVNKEVQAWMPRGVPDGNDWLRVTRNLDKLKQLGKKCKELYGVKRRQTGQRNNNISEQITAYRVLLRSKEYLLSPLDKTKTHHSLSGIELDSDLINFQERATNRRTEYYDTKYENVEATKDTSMVCVTTDERRQMNDIQNQSKSSICDVADNLLENIVDKEYQATLKSELNGYRLRLSRTKRDILIIFHSKLMDVIAEQDIAQDIQENEDE